MKKMIMSMMLLAVAFGCQKTEAGRISLPDDSAVGYVDASDPEWPTLAKDLITLSPNPVKPGEECVLTVWGYSGEADIVILNNDGEAIALKGTKASDSDTFTFSLTESGSYKVNVYPEGFSLPYKVIELAVTNDASAQPPVESRAGAIDDDPIEPISLTIYPNPTKVTHDAIVRLNGYSGKMTCVTYNLEGQYVSQKEGDNPVSISTPSKGVFIISVYPTGFFMPVAQGKLTVN